MNDDQIGPIRGRLLNWFDQHRRDLPWRQTRDPYQILVSEVMLQQTQVDRVIPFYLRFVDQFPDLQRLANTPASEVIKAWAGLGYNRRALNLQRTARAIVQEHDGVFPTDVKSLTGLPGIGPYTAGAIACFAFEQDVSFLDTNMRRVLLRWSEHDGEQLSERAVSELAAQFVPIGQGWNWNQALIEFGALQCRSRDPHCEGCLLRPTCGAADRLLAGRPLKGAKPVRKEGPWKSSSRFYRGRVVAALREEPSMKVQDLVTALPELPDGWPVLEVVAGLGRDGLLQIAETGSPYEWEVSLPE